MAQKYVRSINLSHILMVTTLMSALSHWQKHTERYYGKLSIVLIMPHILTLCMKALRM